MPVGCRLMLDAARNSPAADDLDARLHRVLLDQLCRFARETGSAGERDAASWLVEQLMSAGAGEARIEEHRAHQTFWGPLGLCAAAGGVAGLRAARGRSLGAAALGVGAAWMAADELPPRRRRLRVALPQTIATN